MPERTTRQGCTVTTTTFEESAAGALIEHVVLECKGADILQLVKPDRERNWDWNK